MKHLLIVILVISIVINNCECNLFRNLVHNCTEDGILNSDSFLNKPAMNSYRNGHRKSGSGKVRAGNVVTKDHHVIKLMLVNDFSFYWDHFGGNEKRVKKFNRELVKYMNKIYKQVNFKIKLVAEEVWSDVDKWGQQSSLIDALKAATLYAANELYDDVGYDSVQFITGNPNIKHGRAVGVAWIATVCTKTSVGLNNYGSWPFKSIPYIARLVAHEMGHNLGLNHNERNCACNSISRNCIMDSVLGFGVEPRVWSECSMAAFEKYSDEDRYHCMDS